MDAEEYRRKYEANEIPPYDEWVKEYQGMKEKINQQDKEIQRIYDKYWALLDVYRSNQAALLIIELFLKDLKELLK